MTSMSKLLETFRQPLHEAKDFTNVFQEIRDSIESTKANLTDKQDDPKQLDKYLQQVDKIEQNSEQVKLLTNPNSPKATVMKGYGFQGNVQQGINWLSQHFAKLGQTTQQRLQKLEQTGEEYADSSIDWDEMTVLIKGKYTNKPSFAQRPACRLQATGEFDDGTEIILNMDTSTKMGNVEVILDGIKYSNMDYAAIIKHYKEAS